jgi:hypothetical protein
MNALVLKILPILVYISLLILLFVLLSPHQPVKRKSDKINVSEPIKRQLSLQKPNREPDVFVIAKFNERVNRAASLATIIYVAGVNKQAVNSAIEFALAGADQICGQPNVSDSLILPKNQLANITKFNQALESYNKIIDLADEETINTLENNPTFVTIGQLLKEMRKAVP